MIEDPERNQVVEMRNSSGLWERLGGQCQAPLVEAFALCRGEWVHALSLPNTLDKLKIGNPCRFGNKKNPIYGRELPIGVYEKDSKGQLVTLTKSFRKQLRKTIALKYPALKKEIFPKNMEKEWIRESFS